MVFAVLKWPADGELWRSLRIISLRYDPCMPNHLCFQVQGTHPSFEDQRSWVDPWIHLYLKTWFATAWLLAGSYKSFPSPKISNRNLRNKVEICETKEYLNVVNVFWRRPICDGRNIGGIHGDAIGWDVKTEVCDGSFEEGALLQFAIKSLIPKFSKNLVNMFFMFFFRLRINQMS